MRSATRIGLCLILAFVVRGARGDDAIPIETLKAIKAATVFVKTEIGRSGYTGSGFVMKVDGDSILVVTNDHVVTHEEITVKRMLSTLSIVLRSGTKDEQKLKAEIVATDSAKDLAVLRATGVKNVPAALDFNHPPELIETLPVYISGFPFGESLSTNKRSPAITVGRGSISSLRRNDKDEVSIVQINGDLNPGNSGGAVVDTQGRLVGVAVATIKGTQIGLAIPPGVLLAMLEGKVGEVGVAVAGISAGVADVTLDAKVIDPLKQIRKVSVLLARSDNVKVPPKQGEDGRWSKLTGGREIDLSPAKTGSRYQSAPIKLPSSANKAVIYLVQASYTTLQGATIYNAPVVKRIDSARGIATANLRAEPFGASDKNPTPPPNSGMNDLRGGPSNEPISRELGDIKFVEKRISGMMLPPCMCWAPSGKSFYLLEPNPGRVSEIEFVSLKEIAHASIGKKCAWMCLSSEGLLVALEDDQEIWILGPESLDVKGTISTPGPRVIASCPKLSIAYSTDGQGLMSILDLKEKQLVKQLAPTAFGREGGFKYPAVSSDGKYLFTTGRDEQLIRYRIKGSLLRFEEQGPRLGILPQKIELSPDDAFICLPSVGGNHPWALEGPPGSSHAAGLAPPNPMFIYKTTHLSTPVMTISAGSFPKALAVDAKGGWVYAHGGGKQLVVFDSQGIKLKEFNFGMGETKQFLVHPDGGKFVMLTMSGLHSVTMPRQTTKQAGKPAPKTRSTPKSKQ